MRKRKGSHKGQNGKLLIIGGSEDYVGCLALAGIAALRSGCDYVIVAAPKKVAWAINTLSADLITKKIDCVHFGDKEIARMTKMMPLFDAVLIGTGIGTESKKFIQSIVKKSKVPMVIDADALKYVRLQDVKSSILTPHSAEFEYVLKNSKIGKQDLQKNLGDNVLVLKGKKDYVYTKSRVYTNETGNRGMTKAGTGDVLAGIAAGFLAQGYSLVESASNAAFINGKIGDNLKKKKGYSYIASDIVENIREMVS